MKITHPVPLLNWIRVPQWTRCTLLGLEASPGILRFRRNSEIVYFGAEAISVAKFRRFVTPGGSWKNHEGGRLVHKHRLELRLDYALFDASRAEIERVRDVFIKKHRPTFNFPDHKPKD
jgi:hypothetical protein